MRHKCFVTKIGVYNERMESKLFMFPGGASGITDTVLSVKYYDTHKLGRQHGVFSMVSVPLNVENSKTIKTCVIILLVLALPSLTASEKLCTPGVTYLDPVTEHCDPCSDICELAKEQGTLARCEKLCQGFKQTDTISKPCQYDEYYDSVVNRCESCGSLCLHPISGDECTAHCPNWSHRGMNAESQNEISINSSAMAVRGTSTRGNGSGFRYATVVYAMIGTLILCCVVLLAVFRKTCINKIQIWLPRRKCNKRPYQEEEPGDSTLSLPLQTPGRGPVCAPTDDQNVTIV